ncbi:hypothetical protein [Aestuariimicrobium ganziense]|uniref:hypothetical protein n=1 Tax=Aestuariimicrobium ganziense TaxID=2773677 RepID=UPI001941B0D7|nr:hypothetical protein [Aestuariimicrobium ganziense]
MTDDDLETRLRSMMARRAADAGAPPPLAAPPTRQGGGRRSLVVLAAAAVLLVALVVGVSQLTGGRNGSPAQTAAPATTSTAPNRTTSPSTPPRTPAPTWRTASPSQTEVDGKRQESWQTPCGPVRLVDGRVHLTDQPASLSPGATSMLLCDAGSHGLQVQPPAEVLTTGVAGIIDAYNQSPDGSCEPELFPAAFQLMFSYPDGHTEAVTGQLSSCGPVGKRTGAAGVITAVRAAFDQQQTPSTTLEPPADPCSIPRDSWLPADPSTTVRVYRCAFPQVVGRTATQFEVTDRATLDELRTGLRRQTSDEMGGSADGPWFVAVDQRGRTYQFDLVSDTVWAGIGGKAHKWQPSPTALAALNEPCSSTVACQTPTARAPGR